jgi:hypothetical protein
MGFPKAALRPIGLAAWVLLIPAGPACVRKPVLEIAVRHELGETSVETVRHRAEGCDLLFFNMHEDERTSVAAGLRTIRRTGGQVLTLRHSGERLIRFEMDGDRFLFDPNRIFTERGVAETLARHGSVTESARQAVDRFARGLLTDYGLDSRPVIVALHNNTEGGYSALSYLPGGDYETDAEEVFINARKSSDDFFFVTDRPFFEAFRRAGFNVVLQDNRNVSDDGSLSVLAARLKIPYINVEARHGHLKEQRRMLKQVVRILDQCN